MSGRRLHVFRPYACGRSGELGPATGRKQDRADAARAVASTHEIAQAGGWQSASMVIRYTRKETAKRGAVAKYLG